MGLVLDGHGADIGGCQGAGRRLRLWQFHHRLINFLIIALILFQLVKAANRMRKQAPATPAAPTTTEKLLGEIRDALVKK